MRPQLQKWLLPLLLIAACWLNPCTGQGGLAVSAPPKGTPIASGKRLTATMQDNSSNSSGPGTASPLTCSVLVHYTAEHQASSPDSALTGTVRLETSPPANISSWELSWRFTEGESVARGAIVPADSLSVEGLHLLKSGPPGTPLAGIQGVAVSSNTSLLPGKDLQFTFTGKLGTGTTLNAYGGNAPSNGSNNTQWKRSGNRQTQASPAGKATVQPSTAGRRMLQQIQPSAPSPGLISPSSSATAANGNGDLGSLGSPADVIFNGVVCTPIQWPSQAGSAPANQTTAAESMAEPLINNTPQVLRVEYMPVQYVSATGPSSGVPLDLFSSSFTQMVLRLSNPGSNRTIALSDIVLQYWFDVPSMDNNGNNGGSDTTANANNGALPPPAFKMYCSDASPDLPGGCQALQATFSNGLPGVKGAQYVLNLFFNPDAGFLVPSVTVDNTSLAQVLLHQSGLAALTTVDAIISIEPARAHGPATTMCNNLLVISIEPERYSMQLDAPSDYSYLDTPLRNDSLTVERNSKVVLRQLLPNPRIPAYVGGLLAWGSPPKAGPVLDANSGTAAGGAASTAGPVSCLANQTCHVTASYCCTAGENTTTWPGTFADLSQPPPNWQDTWQQSFESALSQLMPNATAGLKVEHSVIKPSPQPPFAIVTQPPGVNGVPGESSSVEAPKAHGNQTGSIAGIVVGVVLATLFLLAVAVVKLRARVAAQHGMGGQYKEGSDESRLLQGPGGQQQTSAGLPETYDPHQALYVTAPSAWQQQSARLSTRMLRACITACGAWPLEAIRREEEEQAHGREASGAGQALRHDQAVLGVYSAWDTSNAGIQESAGSLLSKEDEEWLEHAPLLWSDKYATMPAAIEDTSEMLSCCTGDVDYLLPLPGCLTDTTPDDVMSVLSTAPKQPYSVFNGAWDDDAVRCGRKASEIGSSSTESDHQQDAAIAVQPSASQQQHVRTAGATQSSTGETAIGLKAAQEMAVVMGQQQYLRRGFRRKYATWSASVAPALFTDYELPLGMGNLLPAPRRRTSPAQQPLHAAEEASPTMPHPRLVWQPTEQIDLYVDYEAEVAPGLSRLIGVGGFGRVYEATWRGQQVAVKIMACEGPEHYQTLIKEVEMCAHFRGCPHIVSLLGACLGPRPDTTPPSPPSSPLARISSHDPIPADVHSTANASSAQASPTDASVMAQHNVTDDSARHHQGMDAGAALTAGGDELQHSRKTQDEAGTSGQHAELSTGQTSNGDAQVDAHQLPIAQQTQDTAVASGMPTSGPMPQLESVSGVVAQEVPGVVQDNQGSSKEPAGIATRVSEPDSKSAGQNMASEVQPAAAQLPTAVASKSSAGAADAAPSSPTASAAVARRISSTAMAGGAIDAQRRKLTMMKDRAFINRATAEPVRLTQPPDVPKQVVLIMELAEGNLAQRLHAPHAPAMNTLEVLQVSRDVAAGLAVLHAAGVIHRDLKPQNVLMVHGTAKIADFGISKFKDPMRSFVSVTQQGGTPQYMAPEQFNGSRVDERCDVYALGCIMYEAFTGKVPWSDISSVAPLPAGLQGIRPQGSPPAPPPPPAPSPARQAYMGSPPGASRSPFGVMAPPASPPQAVGWQGMPLASRQASGRPPAGSPPRPAGPFLPGYTPRPQNLLRASSSRAQGTPAGSPVSPFQAADVQQPLAEHMGLPRPPSNQQLTTATSMASAAPAASIHCSPSHHAPGQSTSASAASPAEVTARLPSPITGANAAQPSRPASSLASFEAARAGPPLDATAPSSVLHVPPVPDIPTPTPVGLIPPLQRPHQGSGHTWVSRLPSAPHSPQQSPAQDMPYAGAIELIAQPAPAQVSVAGDMGTSSLGSPSGAFTLPATRPSPGHAAAALNVPPPPPALPAGTSGGLTRWMMEETVAGQTGQQCTPLPVAMGPPGGGLGALFQIILAVAIHGRRPTIPHTAPLALRVLIHSCWRENPKSRPHVNEVKARLEELIRQETDRQATQSTYLAMRRAVGLPVAHHAPASSAGHGPHMKRESLGGVSTGMSRSPS